MIDTIYFSWHDRSIDVRSMAALRRVCGYSIADIRDRVKNGHPLIEITPFENSWEQDRLKLVDLSNAITSDLLHLVAFEKDETGFTELPNDFLANWIQHLRNIELDIRRSTQLELGEIQSSDEFVSIDDDWTDGLTS